MSRRVGLVTGTVMVALVVAAPPAAGTPVEEDFLQRLAAEGIVDGYGDAAAVHDGYEVCRLLYEQGWSEVDVIDEYAAVSPALDREHVTAFVTIAQAAFCPSTSTPLPPPRERLHYAV